MPHHKRRRPKHQRAKDDIDLTLAEWAELPWTTIELTDAEKARLVELLEGPAPEPTEALVELMSGRRKP